MPRPQHGRRSRSAAAPYGKGQQVRRDRRRAGHINGTSLPDDVLAGIFTRLPDTVDVVRCAATCARWACVVATRAAALSRSLPPLGRFIPELAVGVFHQERDGPSARTTRSNAAAGPQPCFIATASGSCLLGCQRASIGSLFHGAEPVDVGIFDYSRPVASRSGRLVLELRHQDRTNDALTFCVCNPMKGDAVVLPPHSGKDRPTDYGCALLTGEDLDPRRRCTKFFRLLLVYYRRGFAAVRCYSSDTGHWGAEAVSAVKVSKGELRHIGQSVVRNGVVFWPLDHGALGVRLAAHDLDTALDVHLLPYDVPHYWPEKRLLGISPDNRLFFMHFSIRAGLNILAAKISYFDIRGDDIQSGRKEQSSYEQAVMMHQMKMTTWRDTTLKLRWIGEKSGLVLFTMGESSRHNGTFMLNLRDEMVEMVADGEDNQWRNLVGFEMDRAAYLELLAHHVKGE